jgi:excisionase family DNA binding protein
MSHADATATAVKRRRKPYVPTGRPRGRPKATVSKVAPPDRPAALKPAALRVPSAAKYLDVSESLIRKWLKQGVLTSVQIGAARLIPVAGLDALLERRTGVQRQ